MLINILLKNSYLFNIALSFTVIYNFTYNVIFLSLDVLRGYQGEDIEIQLPGNLTVYDIDWLAVWCVQYRHNFGHVNIPKDLDVPPALGQTKITVSSGKTNQIILANVPWYIGRLSWKIHYVSYLLSLIFDYSSLKIYIKRLNQIT